MPPSQTIASQGLSREPAAGDARSMARTIPLSPAGTDWTLSAPWVDIDHRFYSGAQAEIEARRLANRLALGGEDVELVIILRGGQIAARLRYAGRAAA